MRGWAPSGAVEFCVHNSLGPPRLDAASLSHLIRLSSLPSSPRAHSQLEVPLLLLWGEKDPWIVSSMGDRLQAIAEARGKAVRRVSLNAGHCPQDEAPDEVNAGLLEFARRLEH